MRLSRLAIHQNELSGGIETVANRRPTAKASANGQTMQSLLVFFFPRQPLHFLASDTHPSFLSHRSPAPVTPGLFLAWSNEIF